MFTKKLTLFLLFILFHLQFSTALSQIIVTIERPPLNQITVQDLWKLTLNNPTKETFTAYFIGTVEEPSKGKIYEGTSSEFQLKPGINRIRISDLKITSDFYIKEYENIIMRTGIAPEGNYQICVNVLNTKNKVQIGIGCIVHTIIAQRHIDLISPINNEVINSGTQIIFRYTPILQPDTTPPTDIPRAVPYTPKPKKGVTYIIKIVELYPNQSPEAAIQRNFTFYENESGTPILIYPANAKKFESNKQYAWQVKAFYDGKEIAFSDVWTFTISELLLLSNCGWTITGVPYKEKSGLANTKLWNGTTWINTYEIPCTDADFGGPGRTTCSLASAWDGWGINCGCCNDGTSITTPCIWHAMYERGACWVSTDSTFWYQAFGNVRRNFKHDFNIAPGVIATNVELYILADDSVHIFLDPPTTPINRSSPGYIQTVVGFCPDSLTSMSLPNLTSGTHSLHFILVNRAPNYYGFIYGLDYIETSEEVVNCPSCPCDYRKLTIFSDGNTFIDNNNDGDQDPGEPNANIVNLTGHPWNSPSASWINLITDCSSSWISNFVNGSNPTIPPPPPVRCNYVRNFNINENQNICSACIEISADDSAQVYINGTLVGSHSFPPGYSGSSIIEIPNDLFRVGNNVLRIEVTNVVPRYTGLIYCMQLCISAYERDNVLRVVDVYPASCQSICCDPTLNLSQIKVHVSSELEECACPIDTSSASLELSTCQGSINVFNKRYLPDDVSNPLKSGWFIWDWSMSPNTCIGDYNILACFKVIDQCGNRLSLGEPFTWSFKLDSAPPHISMVSPVCAKCQDCVSPDTLCSITPFSILDFYIDDNSHIDLTTSFIRLEGETSSGTTFNIPLSFLSPGVTWTSIGTASSSYKLSINLRTILPGWILTGPYISVLNLNYLKVTINACDKNLHTDSDTISACHCNQCCWYFCDVKLQHIAGPIHEDTKKNK
jgi:hypothetical protein